MLISPPIFYYSFSTFNITRKPFTRTPSRAPEDYMLLGRNMEVLGKLSHEDALRLYSTSWSLLFPSLSEEPLPYSVVESMLLGTIPIAFRIGGVPEILHGTPVEKFICETNDVYCFNERIKEVSSLNYEEVIDLSMKLISVKEIFDRDKIREELMDFPERKVSLGNQLE